MRVFISWSGEPSRQVAEALRDWLRAVIQAVQPWVSAKDIDKGARWSTDIAQELEQAHVGILCLTPGNLAAPWIMFEAGALSKKLGKSLVCPYLLGLRPTDLEGPLVQFQASTANEPDTFTLLATVNRALGDAALPDATLRRVFDKWWPDLAQQLAAIDLGVVEPPTGRSDREILEETLSLVRSLAKQHARYVLSVGPELSSLWNIDPAINSLRFICDAGASDAPTRRDNRWLNFLRASVLAQQLEANPTASPEAATASDEPPPPSEPPE